MPKKKNEEKAKRKTLLPPQKKPQANQELLTVTAQLAQSAVYFVSNKVPLNMERKATYRPHSLESGKRKSREKSK